MHNQIRKQNEQQQQKHIKLKNWVIAYISRVYYRILIKFHDASICNKVLFVLKLKSLAIISRVDEEAWHPKFEINLICVQV